MPNHELPLLPLILDNVPMGLVQALAQEGVPFRHRWKGAMAGRFVLFDSRRGPCSTLGYGQEGIDVDGLREGSDGDPFEALLDHRSARYQWQIASLTVAEDVARVDRRAIRKLVLRWLRRRLEAAGGIWLRISPFPYPYRSAINFRIDYDEYDAADFDATLAAIAGHEEATSHFVNAAAYLPHADVLHRLEGLDIGSHGFRHHTYRTRQENFENIRRGIEALEAFGIEPSGFVAPHGRFNRGLLDAMEDLRIGHSSEFGLAYDDLPFFPYGSPGGCVESTVLQIPIHPVSLGMFLENVRGDGPRRAAATQQAVRAAVDYFRQTARARYRSGEPLFFYGHPSGRLGRFPQLLRAVFDTADTFGAIWKTSLTAFAAWWRVRGSMRLSVVRQGEQFVVRSRRLPPGYRVGVEFSRGRHVARMPLDGLQLRFQPSALAYENRMHLSGVRPLRVDRPEGLRNHVRRMIDWERVTPIDEIPTDSWRNLAKRTLRRWSA